MKKIILFISFLFVSAFVNSYGQLRADVQVVVQTQTNWCWAANSECILNYYGKPTGQCEINDYAWSKSNCCSSPGSCNRTNQIVGKGAIEDIIKHFGDLNSTHVNGGLSQNQITEALTEARPFVIGCMWSGGQGGHVVVGCAYDQSAGTITMMDPWQNNGMTTSKYSQSTVKLNGGSGNWKETLIVADKPITVGIDNKFSKENFNIYPSPNNGQFTIELAGKTGNGLIEIYNLLGERIYETGLKGSAPGLQKQEINISDAPKGNYFVTVKTSAKTYNKMIVKN